MIQKYSQMIHNYSVNLNSIVQKYLKTFKNIQKRSELLQKIFIKIGNYSEIF